MVLLDTNSYTAYFSKDARVKREIDKSQKVFISVISVGELLYGFKKGSREVSNTNDLNDFLGNKKIHLLPVTFKTATIYSTVKYHLKRKGTPIPDNDIWIAASALEIKAAIITFDRHFLKILGLKHWKELS